MWGLEISYGGEGEKGDFQNKERLSKPFHFKRSPIGL